MAGLGSAVTPGQTSRGAAPRPPRSSGRAEQSHAKGGDAHCRRRCGPICLSLSLSLSLPLALSASVSRSVTLSLALSPSRVTPRGEMLIVDVGARPCPTLPNPEPCEVPHPPFGGWGVGLTRVVNPSKVRPRPTLRAPSSASLGLTDLSHEHTLIRSHAPTQHLCMEPPTGSTQPHSATR
jgi:hypothetical protein